MLSAGLKSFRGTVNENVDPLPISDSIKKVPKPEIKKENMLLLIFVCHYHNNTLLLQ